MLTDIFGNKLSGKTIDDIDPSFGNGEEPGFFSGVTAGLAGTAGGLADFTDALTGYGRGVGDYFNNVEQNNARTKEYTWTDLVPGVSDYWTNPQGARYGVGQMVGSSLPLLLAGGGMGALGRAGLKAMGAEGVAAALGKNAATKLMTAEALKTLPEAGAEGGTLYRDKTTADEYGNFQSTDAEARRAAVEGTLKNIPVLMTGNLLEGALLGGAKVPFLSPKINPGDGIAKRVAKTALPPMGVNALQEGMTEFAQEGISGNLKGETVFDIMDSSTWGNPASERQKMAAAEGALGGALLSGAPAAYRGARHTAQASSDPAPAAEPPAVLHQIQSNFEAGKDETLGENGCTVAVKKLLPNAPFVQNANLWVPDWVTKAKQEGVWADASEGGRPGDIAVIETNSNSDDGADHVVVMGENGKYYGNSSSKGHMVEGDLAADYGAKNIVGYIRTGDGAASGRAMSLDEETYKAAQAYLQDLADTTSDAEIAVAANDALKKGASQEDVFSTAAKLGFKPAEKAPEAGKEQTVQEKQPPVQQAETLSDEEASAQIQAILSGQTQDYLRNMQGPVGKLSHYNKAQQGRFIPNDYYNNKNRYLDELRQQDAKQAQVRQEVAALERMKQVNTKAADRSGYDWRKMELEKPKEFKRRLSEEQRLFMDFSDDEFAHTGNGAGEIVKALKDEREAAIREYMDVLRGQMAQGVEKRAMTPSADGYVFTPGYSKNYQWYRDMTANGQRRLNKADLEQSLRDTAIEHLTNGHVDPQYGVQVPPEVARQFKMREDAIRGIEGIQGTAKQYNDLRRGASGENPQGDGAGKAALRPETLEQAKLYGSLLAEQQRGEAEAVSVSGRGDSLAGGGKANDRRGVSRAYTESGRADGGEDGHRRENDDRINAVVEPDIRLARGEGSGKPGRVGANRENVGRRLQRKVKHALYSIGRYYDDADLGKLVRRYAEHPGNALKLVPAESPFEGAYADSSAVYIDERNQVLFNPTKLEDEELPRILVHELVHQLDDKKILPKNKKIDVMRRVMNVGKQLLDQMQRDGKTAEILDSLQGLNGHYAFRNAMAMKKDEDARTVRQAMEDAIKELHLPQSTEYYGDIGVLYAHTKTIKEFDRKEAELFDKLMRREGIAYYICAEPKYAKTVFANAIVKMDSAAKDGVQADATEAKQPLRELPVKKEQSAKSSGAAQAGQKQEATDQLQREVPVQPQQKAEAKQEEISRFGSEEEALEDMLKAFGIEKKPKKALNVIDDSDEALNAALAEFRSELSKLSANAFFNPKLMTAAFKIGMIHLQRGVNAFADWSRSMQSVEPKLKPFLPSVWDAVNAYPAGVKFDEGKMSAVLRYVGTQYDKGVTDKAALKKQLAETIGAEYADLIEPAYAGVIKFPTKEEIQHVDHDSAGRLATRAGEGEHQDAVGPDDGGGEPGGRGQQAVQPAGSEVRARGGLRVHGDRAAGSGEIGNRRVRAEESADQSGRTGSEQLSGGVRDNFDGQTGLDDGRTGSGITAAQNRRDDAAARKVAKQAEEQPHKKPYKAGDLESIKSDLPMLLPEQQDDVVFAERRLLENKGPGVLFTNGTGTGKTFTGLGVVKRFVNQGKKNILIVSPNDKINTEWSKAAKDFFSLPVSKLKDTKDKGSGVVVTTYANMGDNQALVNRDWDLVVVDESQNLMSGEKSTPTKALENLRAITLHPRGLWERFRRLYADAHAALEAVVNKLNASRKEKGNEAPQVQALEKQRDSLQAKLEEKRKKAFEAWEAVPKEDRPKVTFLSATPFAYVGNIDYAEGYLFDYSKKDSNGYNDPNGQEQFMLENFGYRMRYNKLTKPSGDVNSSVMEVQFHEKLRKEGALSGRMLTVDQDYDRGFILVDGGIGNKIDEGFEWLLDSKNGDYRDLYDYIQSQFKHHQRMYLLEAIKARGAVDLIHKYKNSGKKVVIFHDFKKGGAVHPFRLEDVPAELQAQYRSFSAERPDLIRLDLGDLRSPIETLQEAFGDDLLLFNGDLSKKEREKNVKLFQDDDSGKDLILVQSDAGQAGISLHDTTGKHPRVLINLGLPTKPVAAIQIEGRIYRTGQKSNAVFRYLNTGTMTERLAFATKIAERASTAENLALGNDARNLKESFVEAFEETLGSDLWQENLPGSAKEGTGGKEKDRGAREAITDFDRAKTFYYGRMKRDSRTKSAEGTDYFATPEPLGLKLVEWANIRPGEKVLEPSAGHGAISRWFPENTDNVMIEPSQKLAASAQMSGKGNVLSQRFEDYYVGNKFDAVVMNPPFGSGGKTAIEHVAKAFRHLRDGGRIVAIIPNGPSCQKHLEKWLYGNESGKTKAERDGEKDAYLTKEIQLPSAAFERAGTKVSCKVLVIDKQETAEGKARIQPQQTLDLSEAKTIEEFFDRVKDISAPERYGGAENKADRVEEEGRERGGSSEKVVAGEHKNTKTGETQYKVSVKEHLGNDFSKVNLLAKRHDGYYSRYAKGFLFKTEAGRDQFAQEMRNFLESGREVKLSFEMTPEKTKELLGDLKPVSQEKWTEAEKRIADVGARMGCPVAFYDGPPGKRGFHLGGTSYLNRSGNFTPQVTFWHESFHWMRNNNPALYQEIVDQIQKHAPFRKDQIEAYRDTIKLGREKAEDGKYLLTDEDVIEEMLADRMPDVAKRLDLHRLLSKENPSLYERFVAWVNGMLQKFRQFFFNPMEDSQGRLMLKAFRRMAKDMRDAQGRKIFVVNSKGNLELVRTGKEIPADVKIGGAAVAYSADHEPNPIERRAAQLKQLGYSRNEAIDVLVDEYRDEAFDSSLEEYRPGFAQHKELTDKWLKEFERDVKKHVERGIPYEIIEKQLFQRYNQTKGSLNERVAFEEIVDRMARMKGVMWHARRLFKNDIGRNDDGAKSGRDRGVHGSVSFQIPVGGDGGLLQGASGQEGVVSRFLMGSEAWRKEQRRQGKSENILKPPNEAAFSMGKDDSSIGERLKASVKILAGKTDTPESGRIEVRDSASKKQGIDLMDSYFASPYRIAKKVPGFRLFFDWATSAMQKQESLRAEFGRKMSQALDVVKDKQEREDLYALLWRGDAEGKEWSRAELLDEGMAENVADAYVRVRGLMKKMYTLLNDARRQVQTLSKNISEKELQALQDNQFAEIKSVRENTDGSYLVTWKEPKTWKKTYEIDKTALEKFQADPAIQILSQREFTTDEGATMYHVETREAMPDIHKLTGYIPHFFHEYFILEKHPVKGSKDKYQYEVVGSGRNLRDAYKQAEKLLEGEPGKEFVIQAKQFQFDGEAQQAAVVGDREYARMVKKLAEDNTMTVKEAREMLSGAVRLKGRHRFFGNMLQRKGAKGFERDMNWVLRHYFNGASRYVALESEFKPKAVSLFERLYGRFDQAHTGTANYVKDYINDINGNPSALETAINDKLNSYAWWRKWVTSNFGERGALQLAGSITNTVSVLKLGVFNISSALLNFSQLVNSAALIGNVHAVAEGMRHVVHPSMSDKKILLESGVLNDIGLDSGSGYGKLMVGKLSAKSMYFFKRSEELVRRATILAAYYTGRNKGMQHAAAMEYAKEVNRKANFDYGVNDASNMFRRSSIVGQLLLQFKKYPVKELEIMSEMLGGATTAKQKAIFWGGYFLLAGLLQVPALDWFDDIFRYFFGTSPKLKAKEAMMEFAGDDPNLKALVKIANYGVGAAANIDASYRAGLADVIPELNGSLLLGPAGGTVVQTARSLIQGEPLTALKMFSPGMANIVQASIGESKQSRGRTNTKYDDLYDRLIRGMGFRSVDEAVASDVQSIVSANRREKSSEKQEAIDAFLAEPTGENARRLRELGVTPKQVRAERQRKKMSKSERTQSGLSKSEAREYRDLMQFGK